MTITVRSDAAQRFGATPNKQGANTVIVSYDGAAGAGNNIVYVDARTFYRNGNNMGVTLTYEGAGSCVVAGSGRPITSSDTKTQLGAYPWSAVATLNAGDRDSVDGTNVRNSLQFTFTGSGRVFITRG